MQIKKKTKKLFLEKTCLSYCPPYCGVDRPEKSPTNLCFVESILKPACLNKTDTKYCVLNKTATGC